MRCLNFVIILSLFAFFCGSIFAEESRTWKDSTGKFSIEATLDSVDGSNVKLKKTNGSIITLAVSKLSETDQKYIAELAAENPFAEGTESSPIDDKSNGATSKDSGLIFPQKPKKVTLVGADEAGNTGPETWSCEADPAPVLQNKEKPKRLVLRLDGVTDDVNSDSSNFFTDALTGTKTLFCFHVDAVRNSGKKIPGSFTRILLGNALTGKVANFDSPLKLIPLGISPDGTTLMFCESAWGYSDSGTKLVLHFASLKDEKLTPLVSYMPFADELDPNRQHNSDVDVNWAAWVDNENVLVSSEGENLILLNTKTGKAVWRMGVAYHSENFLSYGGKYCLVRVDNGALLLNSLTGETIGTLKSGESHSMSHEYSFSTDGKWISSYGKSGLLLWNATTGEAREPIAIPGGYNGMSSTWVNDNYLLLSGKLVDPLTGIVAWDYVGALNNVKTVGVGLNWVFINKYRQGVFLYPMTIPHPKAVQAFNEIAKDKIMAFFPGMKVSIVLDESIKDARDEVQKSLEKKLKANEFVIEKNAPIKIVLRQTEEKPVKTSFVAGGGFPRIPLRRYSPSEESLIEVTPIKFSMEVKEGDTVLWQRSYITGPPSSIDVEKVKDASLEDIVKKAMEEQTFIKWIDILEIPKVMVARSKHEGASFVTESGIADVSNDRLEEMRLREMQFEMHRQMHTR